ncbi:MAG: glutaredoxin [Eubacteriaceae bacterium]|nr:glutaredoxin [Eubacteriaceae bacterium]
MKRVTIYTVQGCPYCSKAKNLFESQGIEYHEVQLRWDTPQMNDLIARTGHQTVPQIFFGEQFIGGYDQLNAFHKQANLKVFLYEPTKQ